MWGLEGWRCAVTFGGKSRPGPHHRYKIRKPRFPARDFGGNYQRGFQISEEPLDGIHTFQRQRTEKEYSTALKRQVNGVFPDAGISQL